MRILVIAPHNDDEVLGVGGTIAKLVKEGHEITICEVTSGDPELWKMIYSEAVEAHKVLGVSNFVCLHLPVVELEHTSCRTINGSFEKLVSDIKPEVVFLPHIGDMHTDHQATTKAAMVALRPYSNPQLKTIYAYETLSETEWNLPTVDNAFVPDTWSDISDYFDQKVEAMKCYASELHEFPHPRSVEAIEALAKLRGSTIGYKYAEAFKTIRNKL